MSRYSKYLRTNLQRKVWASFGLAQSWHNHCYCGNQYCSLLGSAPFTYMHSRVGQAQEENRNKLEGAIEGTGINWRSWMGKWKELLLSELNLLVPWSGLRERLKYRDSKERPCTVSDILKLGYTLKDIYSCSSSACSKLKTINNNREDKTQNMSSCL